MRGVRCSARPKWYGSVGGARPQDVLLAAPFALRRNPADSPAVVRPTRPAMPRAGQDDLSTRPESAVLADHDGRAATMPQSAGTPTQPAVSANDGGRGHA